MFEIKKCCREKHLFDTTYFILSFSFSSVSNENAASGETNKSSSSPLPKFPVLDRLQIFNSAADAEASNNSFEGGVSTEQTLPHTPNEGDSEQRENRGPAPALHFAKASNLKGDSSSKSPEARLNTTSTPISSSINSTGGQSSSSEFLLTPMPNTTPSLGTKVATLDGSMQTIRSLFSPLPMTTGRHSNDKNMTSTTVHPQSHGFFSTGAFNTDDTDEEEGDNGFERMSQVIEGSSSTEFRNGTTTVAFQHNPTTAQSSSTAETTSATEHSSKTSFSIPTRPYERQKNIESSIGNRSHPQNHNSHDVAATQNKSESLLPTSTTTSNERNTEAENSKSTETSTPNHTRDNNSKPKTTSGKEAIQTTEKWNDFEENNKLESSVAEDESTEPTKSSEGINSKGEKDQWKVSDTRSSIFDSERHSKRGIGIAKTVAIAAGSLIICELASHNSYQGCAEWIFKIGITKVYLK